MPEDPQERIGFVVVMTFVLIVLSVLAAVAIRLVRWILEL